MGIESSINQILNLSITDEDITDFVNIFVKLLKSKQEAGYVKNTVFEDQEWEVIEALAYSFLENTQENE